MTLLRRNTAAKPEGDPAASGAATPSAPSPATDNSAAAASTPAVQPGPSPAVATPAASAVTALAPTSASVLPALRQSDAVARMTEAGKLIDGMRNLLTVDWNTLTRLKSNQGRTVIDNGHSTDLGKWFEFELLSFQDNYLVSPGSDSDDAKKLAKYSDDGVNLKDDPRTVQEYLDFLNESGYPRAKLQKRIVLVASMLDCANDVDAALVDGLLFQIDLPPMSKMEWEKYSRQIQFDLAKGRVTLDQAIRIRATCTIEKQRSGQNKEYTKVNFSRALVAVVA